MRTADRVCTIADVDKMSECGKYGMRTQAAWVTDRRISARIDAPYPVRLRGLDGDGRTFKEQTILENLSGGGLYLRLGRKLLEGTSVSLAVRLSAVPSRDIPAVLLAARGSVLRVEAQADGSYGVAVEFRRRRIF